MEDSDHPLKISRISPILVKWNGKEYSVDVSSETKIKDFKDSLFELTNVRPERQKLLGFKLKGKLPSEDTKIVDLNLKPNQKIMMMGTTEENFFQEPEPSEDILSDFEISTEKGSIPIHEDPENLKKIEKRLLKLEIDLKQQPRPGKKCLVLDIDYTLFDHKSSAERPEELQRPYLHEFLAACYQEYDLVLWSATDMKWVQVKMTELGVYNNPNYKITCALSRSAMIPVMLKKKNQQYLKDVKGLGVLWKKFPEYYNPENTIHIDDVSRNFAMNPRNVM